MQFKQYDEKSVRWSIIRHGKSHVGRYHARVIDLWYFGTSARKLAAVNALARAPQKLVGFQNEVWALVQTLSNFLEPFVGRVKTRSQKVVDNSRLTLHTHHVIAQGQANMNRYYLDYHF